MSDTRRPLFAGSRAVPAQAAAVERWSLPEVGGPVVSRRDDKRKATDTKVDVLRQALLESEARGYQAGLAKAQAESQVSLDTLAAQVKRLDGIVQSMATPLADVDGEVEKQLLQLALAVGKQLARRELRVDPTQVIAIIRESLELLPATARDVRVHLHPEDAAIVRERLAESTNARTWNLVEEPTMTRGGCIVRTDHSRIDARVESRVSEIMASALGEERAPERANPDKSAEQA